MDLRLIRGLRLLRTGEAKIGRQYDGDFFELYAGDRGLSMDLGDPQYGRIPCAVWHHPHSCTSGVCARTHLHSVFLLAVLCMCKVVYWISLLQSLNKDHSAAAAHAAAVAAAVAVAAGGSVQRHRKRVVNISACRAGSHTAVRMPVCCMYSLCCNICHRCPARSVALLDL